MVFFFFHVKAAILQQGRGWGPSTKVKELLDEYRTTHGDFTAGFGPICNTKKEQLGKGYES